MPAKAINEADTAIIDNAMAFDFLEIAPLFRQRAIPGPRIGCESSHFSKRGDDRAKHAAATIKSGTPGRTGKKMPAAPIGTSMKPIPNSKYRSHGAKGGFSATSSNRSSVMATESG